MQKEELNEYLKKIFYDNFEKFIRQLNFNTIL